MGSHVHPVYSRTRTGHCDVARRHSEAVQYLDMSRPWGNVRCAAQVEYLVGCRAPTKSLSASATSQEGVEVHVNLCLVPARVVRNQRRANDGISVDEVQPRAGNLVGAVLTDGVPTGTSCWSCPCTITTPEGCTTSSCTA